MFHTAWRLALGKSITEINKSFTERNRVGKSISMMSYVSYWSSWSLYGRYIAGRYILVELTFFLNVQISQVHVELTR